MTLTRDFYKEKRIEMGKKLATNSIALIYSGCEIMMSADATYPFYTNNNFNYLTGIDEADVILLLGKNTAGNCFERLYLRERDPLKEKWEGVKLDPDHAKIKSGIADIRERKALIRDLIEDDFENLYLDLQMPSHQNWSIDDVQLNEKLQHIKRFDLFPYFESLRLIKTAAEIAMIRKASQLTKAAFEAMRKLVKPGIFEYQLAAFFEYYIKQAGASGIAFETIVASGENAVTLHYIKNNKKLRSGELVLFDMGARLDGYCGDISRTLAVSGEMTKRQAVFYDMVQAVQDEMIKAFKPEASLRELQKQTVQLFESKCRALHLLPQSGNIKDYYYHGIGHSLGMDTHDIRPKGDLILKPGMVMTVEPGLYIKEYGLGIRIEDDVVITEDGCEIL